MVDMLKMWIYACTVATIVSAEVITLISEQNVTCVLTGESIYSALYIWPDCSNIIKRSLTEVIELGDDDWNGNEDKIRNFGPITDIRFEDYKHLNQKNTSVYTHFSVEMRSLSSGVLEIDSSSFVLNSMKISEKKCNWLHFSKIPSSPGGLQLNSVHLTISGRYRARAFRCSETATPVNERGSYINLSNVLNVTNSNYLCISMFIGMTYGSDLQIILECGNNTVTKKFSSDGYTSKLWQRIEIETHSCDGEGRLYFRRICKLPSGCFWAVDYIHLCRQSIEVYSTSMKNSYNYHVCGTVDAKVSTSDVTCNQPGYVGKYCNVSCENVLGKSYSVCNNHKICYEDGECQCAFGYEGEFCDKKLPHNLTTESSDKRHNFMAILSTAPQRIDVDRNISSIALQEKLVGENHDCEEESMEKVCISQPIYAIVIILLLTEFGLVLICYNMNLRKSLRLRMLSENNHRNTIEEEQAILVEECKTKIHLKDFEERIKKIFFNDAYLTQQFDALPKEKCHPCTHALSATNSRKNKDQINIPYDHNRIVLKELFSVGTDDYINASFLNGCSRSEVYITGPGPKFYTVSDFWRMVWQEKVNMIVMATNYLENNERMCAEYWTPRMNTIFECGELTVRIISEKIYEHYDSRILEVHYKRFRREIRHFHLKWYSGNQNLLYANDVIPVLKNIREFTEKGTNPIIIHSGFGANRNGTLILCDLALQMAQSKGYVDFYQLLKNMRDQRPNMINQKEYYMLAHLIVSEYLLETENPFKKRLNDNLSALVIERQINYLERLYWQDSIISSWVPPDTGNSVLDHVYVDGYGQSKKFVVTKQLTEKEMTDFWYLVASEKIRSILFLNKLKNNLWSCKTQNAAIVAKVSEEEIHSTPFYNKIRLSLLLYDSVTNEILNDSEIWVFQLFHWKTNQEVPIPPHNLMETIINIKAVPFDQERILISSSKTGDVGLILAVFYALEKYEKELEVDVCSAIRVVKRSKLNFPVKSCHLKFIYLAIKAYLKSFDKYESTEM